MISKYFHHMLGIFSTEPFYTTYINLPDAHTPLSQKIHNNPKMSPFFDYTLGALNGCHIPCAPPSYSCLPYRNQKGFLSQNCLFACDFDLQSSFAILGGKGLQWMPRSSKEDCKQDFKYQMGITTWLMWVICHQIQTSLLLTMGSGTILLNGAGPIKSK